MPDERRHNPFRILHKLLRLAHCRMIAELGLQDFAAGDAPADLMQQLTQQLELNSTVAQLRCDALQPLLDTGIRDTPPIDRQALACRLAAIAELHSLVRAFHVATPLRRAAAGRTLYRCYALFGAADMAHMDLDETSLIASLHQRYGDAELLVLEGRMFAGIPPHLAQCILELSRHALTPDEQRQLSGQLQRRLAAQQLAAPGASMAPWPTGESASKF